MITALPGNIKFICHNGAGYDQVDIHACTAKGIKVSNVPIAVDDATADTNMFLILGALRGFNTCKSCYVMNFGPKGRMGLICVTCIAMLALREGLLIDFPE